MILTKQLHRLSKIGLNASDIVPGDIVYLEAGDKITADARIIEENNFHTNEASLTGESLPIKKQTKALPKETIVAERKNMVYMGTSVTNGTAKVVVCETGSKTHFGEIASLIKETALDVEI